MRLATVCIVAAVGLSAACQDSGGPVAGQQREPAVGVISTGGLQPSATVETGFACGGFRGGTTFDTVSVATSPTRSTLFCNWMLDPADRPALPESFRGFLCGTLTGTTTNTQWVASPAGPAKLVCFDNID